MSISITINISDTGAPNPLEARVLAALAGTEVKEVRNETTAPASKAEPKTQKAEPKKPEPKAEKVNEKPEPAKTESKAPESELAEPSKEKADTGSGDEDKLQKAVEAATSLVTNGKTAVVKAALAKAGAKRVSELKSSNVQQFLDELGEEA